MYVCIYIFIILDILFKANIAMEAPKPQQKPPTKPSGKPSMAAAAAVPPRVVPRQPVRAPAPPQRAPPVARLAPQGGEGWEKDLMKELDLKVPGVGKAPRQQAAAGPKPTAPQVTAGSWAGGAAAAVKAAPAGPSRASGKKKSKKGKAFQFSPAGDGYQT